MVVASGDCHSLRLSCSLQSLRSLQRRKPVSALAQHLRRRSLTPRNRVWSGSRRCVCSYVAVRESTSERSERTPERKPGNSRVDRPQTTGDLRRDDAYHKRKRRKSSTSQQGEHAARQQEEEGVFSDYGRLIELWDPLGQSLQRKQAIAESRCAEFGSQLRALLREHPRWSGRAMSTALHRLAVLRDSQEHFPEECRISFLMLASRIGESSPRMEVRSMSMCVWAIGKLVQLEGYKVPGGSHLSSLDSLDSVQSSSGSRTSYSSIEELLEADYEQIYGNEGSGEFAGRSAAPSWGLPDQQQATQGPEQMSASPSGREDASNADALKPDSASLVPLSKTHGSDGSLDGEEQKLEETAAWQSRGGKEASSFGEDTAALLARRRRPLRLRRAKLLPLNILTSLDGLAQHWLESQDAANAQAVSNLAWGFGRLGYSPLLGDLFRALQQQVIDLAWCMRGQDVSNLWWAYGELLEPLGDEAVRQLSLRTLSLVRNSSLPPISVPIILQACDRLDERPFDGKLADSLLLHLYVRNCQPLKRLTAESMTTLLTAVAGLQPRRAPEFAEAWAEQFVRRVSEYDLTQAVAVVKACRALRVDPLQGRLVRVIEREHLGFRTSGRRLPTPPKRNRTANATLPPLKI